MLLSCSGFRPVLFLFFLLSCSALSAQKEPAIWLFGDHNGIDFRSGSPVAIANPSAYSVGVDVKGVSTVTDANGNLLFYGEDQTLFDGNHNIMQNGSGISGVWAATQTGLTVRAIYDTSLYYVFTINMYEINGMSYAAPDLWYSVVDMKKNNGLGAVTIKNVRLFSGISTTQISAVRHCNERDIWVISHEWNSDVYLAFLVTQQGVSTTPIVSHSGRSVVPGVWGTGNQTGYMKVSPDGKKIAASWRHMGADLSDFDNETGTVSNSINLQLIPSSGAETGSIEFSPNSSVLYAAYGHYPMNLLYQYNVNAGSADAIRASKTKLEEIYFFGYFAGMQRGPDNNIYVATQNQPNVAIIHDPNTLGVGCNYILQGLALPNRSSHNFPAYIESKYYYPDPEFTFTAGCSNELVSFTFDKPPNVVSIKWDFDDPSSGTSNTSTDLNPIHEFTAEGTYQVKLILFSNCKPDTLTKAVSVQKIKIDLGNDTAICKSAGFIIRSKSPLAGSSYLWSTGSNSEEISVSTAGLYWLQVNTGGCFYRDTIIVTLDDCALGVPNAFTPDGDGKNDVFSISKTNLLSSFIMQVYNRWGQKIYETRNQGQGWNGTLGGRLCDPGHYPYIIQYQQGGETPVTLKGMVLLIR